jgi:restriction endonuclease S subunit
MSNGWPRVRLDELLRSVTRDEATEAIKEYRLLGVRLDGQGPFLREVVSGTQTSASTLFRVAKGDFIYSRLFAWRGAFGVISAELDGCYVSGEFPTFLPTNGQVDVNFLRYWFRLPSTLARVEEDCTGSTPLTRNRFKEQFFLSLEIPLPPLAEQQRIVARIEELASKVEEAQELRLRIKKETNVFFAKLLPRAFEPYGAAMRPIGEIFTVTTGGTPSRGNPAFWGGDVKWVSSGEVNFRIIDDTAEKITRDGVEMPCREQSKCRCYPRLQNASQPRVCFLVAIFTVSAK